MNRTYSLVWNRALRTVQVASELARSHGGSASAGGASSPRRHPLTLACATVLALVTFAAPAWPQTCTPSATQTCGSAGGIGGAGNGGYGGYGGVGNGGGAQGGGNGGPSAAGAIGTGGNGGAGSAGDPQNPGGAGGSVGATSIGGASIQGGAGGTPPAGGNASRGSGGGGGGGAGVYTTDTNLDLAAGLSIHGGDGGDGALGDTMGGGGGGGGAGVMAITAATTFTNAGTIAGGDGGDGATAGWSGGGGGGGDGVLMAGANSSLTNTGSIAGGAGGNGPAAGYFFGTGGQGGVGVNATADNVQIVNSGSITGGTSNNGTTRADAVKFWGAGDSLTLESGSQINGAVEVISGASATITADANGLDLASPSPGGDALIIDGATTLDTNGHTLSVSGTISGSAPLTVTGGGTLTLSGSNTFSGGTTIDAGTLSVSSDANLGASSGALTFAGGTLQAGADFSSARDMTVQGSGDFDTNGFDVTLTGSVTGAAGDSYFDKTGAGALTLAGNGSLQSIGVQAGTLALSGNATLEPGNLDTEVSVVSGATFDISQISAAGTAVFTLGGDGTVDLGDKMLTINAGSSDYTFAGVIEDGGISGATGGGLTVTDSAGTATLTGANTFTGGTTVTAGTLALSGDGALSSTGAVAVDAHGTFDISGITATGTSIGNLSGAGAVNIGTKSLTLNTSGSTDFAGTFVGSGSLVQAGSGALTLDGASSFPGSTTVSAGSLYVGSVAGNGAMLAGSIDVDSGATLGGFGTAGSAGDAVTLANGSVLAPGVGANSVGTLTFDGGLTLDAGSQLDFDFGAPGADAQTAGQSDGVDVVGALDFEGTATLNLTNAGGMGPGLYNLASYGSLVTNGCSFSGGTACIAIGTLPQGALASQFNIVNNTQGSQIDLYNTAGLTLNLWDPSGDPAQLGGDGTWTTTSPTWTDTAGDGPFAMSPQPGFAIFQGTPGTVTVDDTAGAVSITGMQFAVDGYASTGDALTLVGSGGNAPIIEVGDGTSASAGMTATVGNELDGDGFAKTGGGTLVLTGPMHLQGDIEVQAGTLQNETTFANALEMAAGTTLANVGRLNYTQAGLGDAGAAAVTGAGFTVVNGGYISGGYAGDGGAASGYVGGTGGVGIQGSGFTLTNNANALVYGGLGGNGSVAGGAGGAAIAGSDFTVTNAGYVYGWAGGFGPTASGVGGAGIAGSGFTVTNSGRITGGYGGNTQNGTGGLGGAGISGSDFMLTNTGTIVGGEGGPVLNGTGTAGAGGAGVYSTGGSTVINEGTISGGMSGDGSTQADAIDFTGGGNTLELVAEHPGTLNGALVVTRQAGDPADTLELGGDSGSDTFDLAQLASGGLYDGFNAEAKSGASTWTLTGAGSASENWTVEGGTLVGDATTFQGSIAFAPASGATATVEFDQGSGNANSTADATYAGVISGAGDLVKSGDGTLTLTGANTFTGSTTISAGTLQVGDGGTTGAIGTGAIVDNGTLIFDRSDAITLTGAISGSGSLTKQGTNTLTVNGDGSAFTGTTTIPAGTLVVGDDSHAGASLGGMVTIAKGAALEGIGTLGGLDLSGTLNPGGSIGTLHVTGDATFEAGSTFNVEADPSGKADQLAVGGKATIKGGNTLVIAQPGNWNPTTTYTIITSGQGVSGTFDGVSDDQAFLTPTLAYTANEVDLTLARNQTTFPDVADTPNEKGAAAGIEGAGAGNALYDAVVKLNAADARVAFDQTSGEYYASQQTARIDDSRYIREAMNQRLRKGDADSEAQKVGDTKLSAWAHAWGHWGTVDSDGNAAKLADNGDGLLIGADLPVGAGRVGFTGGASRNSLSVNQRDAWGRETSTWLGVFGGVNAGAFGFRAGLAYAWDQVPGNRAVDFPGYSDRLSGEATGSTFTGFIEGAWTFKFGHGSVSPFLNLANTRVATHAFTEEGGAAALQAESSTTTVTFGTLGARGAIDFAHHLDLHGELGWQHAFRDRVPEQTLQFVAGGPAFTEYGVPIAKDAGIGRVGLGWHHGAVAVDADYEGLAGNGVKDQAAKLSVSVAF